MGVQANESMTKISHPHTFVCDVRGCFYRTSHKTVAQAYTDMSAHELSGMCPNEGKKTYLLEETDERGQRYTAIHMAKNLGEKLWDQLDNTLDQFMLQRDDSYLKGMCSAYALAIHLMQTIYYPTVDDVTREAVRRRKMRLKEIDCEQTPGYNFNPPPVGSKAYEKANKNADIVEPKKEPKTNYPKPAAVALTSDTDAKIAKALETGLFEDADIASSFNVPVAYISALRARS